MSTLERDPTDRVQVLDEDGRVREDATVPDLPEEELVEIYREMKLARRFDERAVRLQRQGRVGTFPPQAGQEGAQVASTHALDDEDWIFPSYREHGVMFARGLGLTRTLLYWMGHGAGNAPPTDRNVFSVAVPIATHIPHATGMAWAAKLGGDSAAAVCHFGDGATSEGDFHEGLNFAGVFDVPAVFFCNNNQWAISVPRERQTASNTLAQKARAYGFEGVQVDGMDPLAVYRVTRQAIEKAKADSPDRPRPTLIEAVQYRFGAHTTADDPERYRDDADLERWKRRDPIPRFETFLRERGLLDDEAIAAIETDVDRRIEDLVDAALAYEPDPDDLFAYAYAEPTPRVRAQREYLRELRDRHGDDALTE